MTERSSSSQNRRVSRDDDKYNSRDMHNRHSDSSSRHDDECDKRHQLSGHRDGDRSRSPPERFGRLSDKTLTTSNSASVKQEKVEPATSTPASTPWLSGTVLFPYATTSAPVSSQQASHLPLKPPLASTHPLLSATVMSRRERIASLIANPDVVRAEPALQSIQSQFVPRVLIAMMYILINLCHEQKSSCASICRAAIRASSSVSGSKQPIHSTAAC